MSTLEKFGILVILILVVIIGVVAVWGVGGEKDAPNPFETNPPGENVAAVDPGAVPLPGDPAANAPGWPSNGAAPASNGPVPPPALGGSATPASAGGGVAPAPAAGTATYTVQKGDTGEGIARKTGVAWKAIADLNKKDPRKLKIGEVLRIPGGTNVADTGVKVPGTLEKSLLPPPAKANDLPKATNPADGPTEMAPAPKVNEAAGREVEVRSGDTLYEIARRELGDPNLYYKILKANPGLDPKKLKVGMKVRLPAL